MSITYRPDIDGLRALAVLSVIVFHLDSRWLSGGFLGVDIFFVISGFLITRIIAEELQNNQFSFSVFYVRRMRRILPVFFVVIFSTVLAATWVLLPADFSSLVESAKAALFFVANMYFAKEGGYFDLSADQKPLHHLWSLSVEEQFYFIWPLLFFGIYRITRQYFNYRMMVLGVLALALLVLSEFYMAKNLHRAYYVLPARAIELAVGALAALWPQHKNYHSGFLARLGIMQAIPLLLLTISLVFYSSSTRLPGIIAMVPALSVAILLRTGGEGYDRSGVTRALTWSPLVWIGKLSYSLYLWHWPVLALMRYVYGDKFLPLHWLVLACILIFLLSAFSYYLVETPMRKKKWSLIKAFLMIYLLPAACIMLFATMVQASPSMEPPKYSESITSYGKDICHGRLDINCTKGDVKQKPSVLVIGDSHAAHYNGFIDVVGKHEKWSATVVSGSSCSPVFDYDETVLPGWAQKPCTELKSYVRAHWENYDAIIIASSWAYQMGLIASEPEFDRNYLKKLIITINDFTAKGKNVYLLADVPRLAADPFRVEKFKQNGIAKFVRPPSGIYLQANATIKALTAANPNVHWVDTDALLKSILPASVEPLYMDSHHLNLVGSKKLGEAFIDSGKILLQSP